jgi:hypothetical protein
VKIAIVTAVLLLFAIGGERRSSTRSATLEFTSSSSEVPQRQNKVDSPSATGTPCLFNFERGELPNCVLTAATGELSIAPQYLKELSFDSHGLTAVRAATEGWMYANRKGRVVISGVPQMDNWADEFHDGLVRFVRDKKYGFANRKGQIVIPPVYDGAMKYEKRTAKVCKGCRIECVELECEYSVFSGGDWFLINTKGAVLKQLQPNN